MNTPDNHELNTINRAAGYALGAIGLDRSPAEILSLHPDMRRTFESIAANQKYLTSLRAAILDYSCIVRIPLLDIIPQSDHSGDEEWALPVDYRLRVATRLNRVVGLSPENQSAIVARLESINLNELGRIIDAELYDYFAFHDTRISVVVFGSFLWKWSFRDIDLAVIAEDNDYGRVEVGSHTIMSSRLADFLSRTMEVHTGEINVSLVDRSAIRKSLYSHDLCNIATWTAGGGLCVKGQPITYQVSDFMLLQTVLINMGFFFKNCLAEKNTLNKGIENTIECLQFLLVLAQKYQIAKLDSVEDLLQKAIARRGQVYDQMNLVMDANDVASQTPPISHSIKIAALDLLPAYLASL